MRPPVVRSDYPRRHSVPKAIVSSKPRSHQPPLVAADEDLDASGDVTFQCLPIDPLLHPKGYTHVQLATHHGEELGGGNSRLSDDNFASRRALLQQRGKPPDESARAGFVERTAYARVVAGRELPALYAVGNA